MMLTVILLMLTMTLLFPMMTSLITVKVSIAWRCMNEGDVFILDVGEILYVWNGKSSSRTERIKVCL